MGSLVDQHLRRRDVAAVFLLALGYLSAFAGVLTHIGDEGTLVTGAALTAAGAVPYRDFADLANPLSYYWLGAWFAMFGTTFAVARTQLILTGAASTAIVYALTVRAYGRRAGVTAATIVTVLGIPFWPGTNHHWDSNLFYLGTMICLAAWQVRPSAALAGLAGLTAAATSGFVLDKGGLALLVALAVTWRRADGRAATILACVGGYAVGLALIVAPFLAHGALADLFYVNVVFPATRYEGTRRLIPYAFYVADLAWRAPLSVLTRIAHPAVAYLMTALLAVPLVCVVVTPLAAVALAAHQVVFARASWTGPRSVLWLGGMGLLVSELHRWDMYHLLYGTPLLLSALVGTVLAREGWRRQAVTAAAVCTVCLGVFQAAQALSARVTHMTRRGTVRVVATDEALQFLLDNTTPGDDVFVYPYYGMYYFLAAVRNPTRFAILMYGYNTDAQFRESIERLEGVKPRYVLWDTTFDGDKWNQWYPNYVPPAQDDRVVERYLASHYRQIDTKGTFRIMERAGGAAGR